MSTDNSTPIQFPLNIERAHNNQFLFSDHYLDHLLPINSRWQAALSDAATFLDWLRRKYAQEKTFFDSYNESQLETHWFKPILTQIGHIFEGQASIPGLGQGVKHPDYVFFPTETTRQAAVSAQKTTDYVAQALAIGEVKRWDRPLSKKLSGGKPSFEDQNPSWQIDYYVRATGLSWGILSNGRLWRLVHKDTSQRIGTTYYEIDLINLLERNNPSELRYFTLFFNQAAFLLTEQGNIFLEEALTDSRAYAVLLEEDLSENAYRALKRLMQGFLDLSANCLGLADLRTVYDNSLYLLYRLLFILYGESRGLLPLDNPQYRDTYSLQRLEEEIATLKTQPAPMTKKYWATLQELFRIIDGSDADLNQHVGVPRYNGGLFSPQEHPFLERYAVGDQALVNAIDLLSRRQTSIGREFVDYRTLGVRQLGSIYEGLLEYQPRYADQEMVAIREEQTEYWIPATEAPANARIVDRCPAHQIYLATDRNERKATGSYYTPDYIVEYMVAQALSPLVEAATARIKDRALQTAAGIGPDKVARSLADEILALRVVDPAMGSGHFLVEATEFLGLALATDLYLTTDSPDEDDLIYWKRRIVEQCIYGTDKNRLAVELAKLSLWLATLANDKPLSFLDHHLKHGDSLAGAWIADLGMAPPTMLTRKQRAQQDAGQMNMFEYRLSQRLPVVMGKIQEITSQESDSYETIQTKEAIDAAIRDLKAPFQAVANLWLSAYFGHKYTQADYDEALDAIERPNDLLALRIIQDAQSLASQYEFFHWQLAFPEAYYDRQGQPLGVRAGFDALVGNPPYDVLKRDSDKPILSQFIEYARNSGEYKSVLSSMLNIFHLMITRSAKLLAQDRYLSQIVPLSLLSDISASGTRRLLIENHNIVDTQAFPQKDDENDRVFKDAKLSTIVFIAVSGASTTKFTCRVHPGKDILNTSPVVTIDLADIQRFDPETLTIPLGDPEETKILQYLYMQPHITALRTVADVQVGEIDMTIDRGCVQPSPAQYELLKGAHLQRFFLRKKPKQGVREWIDLDAFNQKYGLSSVKALPSKSQRVAFQAITGTDDKRRLKATFTPSGFFLANSLNYLVVTKPEVDPHFLLTLLNSQFYEWRFRLTSTNNNVNNYEILAMPYRIIQFTTPDEQRAGLRDEGIALYKAGRDGALDGFVRARLAAQPEQSDVVHDLLAQFAQSMIDLFKQKQRASENFWTDVEGVTDTPTFRALDITGNSHSTR